MPQPTEVKAAPRHNPSGNDEHEIQFGRTLDVHQNPICKACDNGLNVEEFEAARHAGLV